MDLGTSGAFGYFFWNRGLPVYYEPTHMLIEFIDARNAFSLSLSSYFLSCLHKVDYYSLVTHSPKLMAQEVGAPFEMHCHTSHSKSTDFFFKSGTWVVKMEPGDSLPRENRVPERTTTWYGYLLTNHQDKESEYKQCLVPDFK